MRNLPYRKPVAGTNYWVVDNVLAEPMAVRARGLASDGWEYGFPHTREAWPGVRANSILTGPELAALESRVCELAGVRQVWAEHPENGLHLSHNCAQIVKRNEGRARPHTDSRSLCRLAGVLYLTPDAPQRCGTAFYRQRLPDGSLGGNSVEEPHNTLADALGTRFVHPDSLVEDVRIHNRFNRLFLYRSNLIHSATKYCGLSFDRARMTALFFWMA